MTTNNQVSFCNIAFVVSFVFYVDLSYCFLININKSLIKTLCEDDKDDIFRFYNL